MNDISPVTVSIIIPVYNRANIIKRSIDSALSQSFQDFELLIVDDHSTDNIRDIISELQNKDSRVKYFYNEGNRGPSAARNLGIAKSNGNFIAFLDSDDVWNQQHLERNIKYLKEYNLDLIFSDMEKIKDGKVILQSIFHENHLLSKVDKEVEKLDSSLYRIRYNYNFLKRTVLIGTGVIIIPTLVYRKKNVAIKFNEDLMIFEDDLFNIEALLNNIRVGFIIEVGLSVLQTSNSISRPIDYKTKISRHDDESYGRQIIIDRFSNILDNRSLRSLKYQVANHLNMKGNILYQNGQRADAMKTYYQALKRMPMFYLKKRSYILLKLLISQIYKEGEFNES